MSDPDRERGPLRGERAEDAVVLSLLFVFLAVIVVVARATAV